MGAEAKAKEERRKRKAARREMEAVILAARERNADEVLSVAAYLSRKTGVPVETCLSEVRAWLSPHLVQSSSASSADSSPSGGGSSPEPANSAQPASMP